VNRRFLGRLRFTNHAIERFAARGGLRTADRRIVEPVARELLLREGLIVGERPRWAHSRNQADLYVQLGEWMLFILQRAYEREDGYAVVTVISHPDEPDWNAALRHGYVLTAPPPAVRTGPRRVWLLGSAIRALRTPGPGSPAKIRHVHRARRARAQEEYERGLLDWAAAPRTRR
jgi:hypothetical protein